MKVRLLSNLDNNLTGAIIMVNSQHKIHWDWGTAYDFFFSLHVLHNAESYGLRASWAAGVRSRLPIQDRNILEDAQQVVPFPLAWVHSLPEPKDSASVVSALASVAPMDRLATIFFPSQAPDEVKKVLTEVSQKREWDEGDLDLLKKVLKDQNKLPKEQKTILKWWSRPDEFGERYLSALQTYRDSFFEEEERRITPKLQEALEKARSLAEKLSVPNLLEELSQGVRFVSLHESEELVLAPSYWSSPLIFYDRLDKNCHLVLFGARPADTSLVPGEVIPDNLLKALKALADPTRLSIMRYLSRETLTPAQLSRYLRLRTPTVLHHLRSLRLAGLVRLSLEDDGEKRYAARPENVGATYASLKNFLDLQHKD
jgi:DNA-binding transcriptional ArsR family regulator